MAKAKSVREETLDEYLARLHGNWKRAIGYCHLMSEEMLALQIGKDLVALRKSDAERNINDRWTSILAEAKQKHGEKEVSAIMKKLRVNQKSTKK